MSAPASAGEPNEFRHSVESYLSLLRDEIMQAQRLRMQAHGAKIVFLGGLYTYALKGSDIPLKGPDTLAMLVGPFVAFFFDSIIYGLTYNIQQIGAYICHHLEPLLLQGSHDRHFRFWENAKGAENRTDWGRAFAKVGNYGISLVAAVVSFVSAWPHVRRSVLLPLLGSVMLAYALLAFFEWRSRGLLAKTKS